MRRSGSEKGGARHSCRDGKGRRGPLCWHALWTVVAMTMVAGSPALAQGIPSPLHPPVVPACVSSPFGPRALPGRPKAGTFHPGIDLPAPAGAPVLAVAPGRVIRVQRKGPGGIEMLIQHPGFVGVYSHLGLIAPPIMEGNRTVRAGQRVGVVGRSGVSYGAHLYFGMLVDRKPVDPAPLLGIGPCGSSAQARVQ
jgi:murein DD-endopeptidase MepM/ murein hydrolase activator NlpD